MTLRGVIIGLAFLLTGCSTFVGHSKTDLVNRYGIPNSTMQTDSGEIYQYQDDQMIYGSTYGHKKLYLIKDNKIIKQWTAN